jgi:hypothetical protein
MEVVGITITPALLLEYALMGTPVYAIMNLVYIRIRRYHRWWTLIGSWKLIAYLLLVVSFYAALLSGLFAQYPLAFFLLVSLQLMHHTNRISNQKLFARFVDWFRSWFRRNKTLRKMQPLPFWYKVWDAASFVALIYLVYWFITQYS